MAGGSAVADSQSNDVVWVGHEASVATSDKSLHLPDQIVAILASTLKITELFPMQAAVQRHVVKALESDVVLCAPTGSGKTLAYALPIVTRLSSRIVRRLRAVVVVPTRDLATQIHAVFESLSMSSGLAVGIASGALSVKEESISIRNVDILVATPGRLVEHTRDTQDFSLSAVQFLVLDESDRLLLDSFHDWVPIVVPECGRSREVTNDNYPAGLDGLATHVVPGSRRPRRKPLVILASATQTRDPKRLTLLDLQRPAYFMTSTLDGDAKQSIAASCDPDLAEVFSLPDSLVERAYVLDRIQEKPMALATLLGLWKSSGEGVLQPIPDHAQIILVFTNAVDSAHRLTRLLEILVFHTGKRMDVLEMSGSLSSERRSHVLRLAAANTAQKNLHRTVIVCSDYLARGMDIDGVGAVVNYDAPVHVNTYLHRVGRTARAGRVGVAISLVQKNQARHFKAVVRAADRGIARIRIKSVDASSEDFDDIGFATEGALEGLRRTLRREALGLLQKTESLPAYALRDIHRTSGMQRKTAGSILKKRRVSEHLEPGLVGAQGDVYGENGASPESPEEDEFSELVRAQVACQFLGKRALV